MFESLYTAYDHGYSDLALNYAEENGGDQQSQQSPILSQDHNNNKIDPLTHVAPSASLDDYSASFFLSSSAVDPSVGSISESSVRGDFLDSSVSPSAEWTHTFSNKHGMESVDTLNTLTSVTDSNLKIDDDMPSPLFYDNLHPSPNEVFSSHDTIGKQEAISPSSSFMGDDQLSYASPLQSQTYPTLNMRFSNFSTSNLSNSLNTVNTILPPNLDPQPTSASEPYNYGFTPNFQPQPAVVKWVRLTPMTPERISSIHSLAATKGIGHDVVDSVLSLYLDRDSRHDNHVTRFRDGEIHMKIIVGLNCGRDENPNEDGSRRKRNKRMQKDHNYVKRPLNSFMLYRRSQTQSAMAQAMSNHLKLNHQNISQIIGLMWQTESQELKDLFSSFASQEKSLHKAMYPDYKFSPQKKRRSSLVR